MSAFADMAIEVSHLAAMKAPDVKINVGDMTAFVGALERCYGPLKDAGPSKKVASAEFCGVQVFENEALPQNMAAIIQDGKLVNLIRFADV